MNKLNNLPEEIRQLDRWVCWKIEERDGKPTKVPVNPSTGGRAMSNNPQTWGPYRQAVSSVKKYSCNGIGFMFNGDGLLGVDLDHARDPNTKKIEPWAMDIIDELDSYTEISQSGTGIHILCYGKLPSGKRRRGNVEMYETGRYFIMTGDILDDAHADIEDRAEQLVGVHTKYLQKKQKKNAPSAASAPANLSAWEIIDKAGNAKNGNKFRQLMNGDISGYNSQSEADLALCNIIAFYNQDAATVDTVYRQSKLMREKWDEMRGEDGTYGQITINRAIQDATAIYLPRGGVNTYNSIEQKKEYAPGNLNTTTDLDRSKIYSSKVKGRALWNTDTKAWYIWDSKKWAKDSHLKIIQEAKQTVEDMVLQAGILVAKATGEEQVKVAKKVFTDTVKAKNEKAIKAMIELSKSDLAVTSSQFDSDPFLLNCQNGVLDLRTGKLLEHSPKYFMNNIANASYKPGKFKLFGEFMRLITCGDAELARYLQQIVGMAAIGKVFHEGLCIFYNTGQNGKSTFLNCVRKIFGGYAENINPEMLMAQRDGKQPIGITKLDKKRFVTAIETDEGRRISGVMLKQLASTDPITGREMYQSERTFDPTHTLIMATNHLPKVSSTDIGTWRRIAVVPFNAVIESNVQIKDYASVMFEADKDAILSWIVEGAMKYISNNYRLNPPEAVKIATEQYYSSEDWLGNFLDEKCEVGNYEESGGLLYRSYSSWCETNNEYKRRPRDFTAALETRGFTKRKTMHGAIWSGLKLLNAFGLPQYSGWSQYKQYKNSSEDEEKEPNNKQIKLTM